MSALHTPRTNFKDVRFKLLTRDAQHQLTKYEHVVVGLMILVAATSILWTVSLHILSGDFHNNLIGAKLEFHNRDLGQLDERAKQVFAADLERVYNESYLPRSQPSEELAPVAERRVMPRDEDSKKNFTAKPKKIPHLFQFSGHQFAAEESEEEDYEATTALPKPKLNIAHDKDFLATRAVNSLGSVWNQRPAVQFMYSFPFLSEFVAIVWTAMCLIYQTTVKKYWGVPKPWRIVLPSILVFSLMTLGSLVYTVMANGFVKSICSDLRANLSDPSVISCGQAMSILRPHIRQHAFSHTAYLNLFRASYMLATVFWVLAVIVMALRYFFAIDFQLIDVTPPPIMCRGMPQQSSAQRSTVTDCGMLRVDEHRKSDDDYASAKSHFSEVATPLLNTANGATEPPTNLA